MKSDRLTTGGDAWHILHMTAKKTENGSSTPKTPYPYETFVKNWTKATSTSEVLAMTGLSRSNVASVVQRLRKAGVKLKQMPRSAARPIDVAALNKIIKDATPVA